MLRIEYIRLAAGNPEEVGVEAGHVAQVAAGAKMLTPVLRIPSARSHPRLHAVGLARFYRVAAFDQQLPQRGRRVGVARQSARHADNGDLIPVRVVLILVHWALPLVAT